MTYTYYDNDDDSSFSTSFVTPFIYGCDVDSAMFKIGNGYAIARLTSTNLQIYVSSSMSASSASTTMFDYRCSTSTLVSYSSSYLTTIDSLKVYRYA